MSALSTTTVSPRPHIPFAIDHFASGLALAARGEPGALATVAVTVVANRHVRWTDDAIAAWTSADLSLVGIGIARELRASGRARWTELAAAARSVRYGATFVDGVAGEDRPRWLGGAAFVPGAADRAPWTGFGDAWFALPRWTYVIEGDRARLVLAVTTEEAGDRERWQRELARLCEVIEAPVASRAPAEIVERHGAPADEWRQQVEAITAAIARGECSKIVAARTCNVQLATPVRVADVLAAFDERQPECVRVALRPPGANTLVAATPERLVRASGSRVECDALAGTIAPGPGAAEALLASAKDRREHALVVDAIAAVFDELGANTSVSEVPQIKKLRHVLHLHTPFVATLPAPRHVLELVGKLHPTPAMGGTPTHTAVDWIAHREPAPRGWYASPIGWFDDAGNGEFAVAIRSGVLAGTRAHLWAGAGIVAGSDPQRELAETESKLRAMLGVLGVTP